MIPPAARFDVSVESANDFLNLPARRAVIVCRDADDAPALVAVTGDARAFARRRLGAGDDAGPTADLRPIARTLHVITAGSMFEADLLFLATASALMPSVYRAAADRWQAWFVRLDPNADDPTWRKRRLRELDRSERDPRVLLGPMRDKDAAGRFGESLDDLFDLCRYPAELAKAPSGTACAYHEMGRCPAPCDGSESMATYRARVGEAIASVTGDVASKADETERDMRAAAGRQDFERAARLKDRVERLRGLTTHAFKWMDRLDRFRLLAVTPSERAGWARLIAIAGGRWRMIADVDASRGVRDAPGLEPVVAAADEWVRRQDLAEIDDAECDAIGLIAGYLYSKPKLTRGGFVRRAPDALPGEITPELLAACRSAIKGEESDETHDRELSAT